MGIDLGLPHHVLKFLGHHQAGLNLIKLVGIHQYRAVSAALLGPAGGRIGLHDRLVEIEVHIGAVDQAHREGQAGTHMLDQHRFAIELASELIEARHGLLGIAFNQGNKFIAAEAGQKFIGGQPFFELFA